MEEYTAYEIWKAIHYTMASKMEKKHGFESMTKFVKLDDVNLNKKV